MSQKMLCTIENLIKCKMRQCFVFLTIFNEGSVFRETDKLLVGGIYPIIFLEYPIVFQTGGNKMHRN